MSGTNRRGLAAAVFVAGAVVAAAPTWTATAAAPAAGVIPAATAVTTAAAAADETRPWLDTSLSTDQRVELLLNEMSLDQVVELLVQTGGQGIPELGIPAIRGKDASNGLGLTGIDTTALPVGLALASTFDEDLAAEYGAVVGEQTRAVGYNSAAAPSIDLARSPWNGRIWESAGEDPFLTGRMGAVQTEAIQDQDIPAEVKHYNVYNQETRRGHVNAVVDQRTLREVYTRPWEIVVDEAQPGSVMCSFNKINDAYGCGSRELLTTILKKQLGFQGFVQSDFNAAQSFADYAAGLDTSGEKLDFSNGALRNAIHDGTVSVARFVDAARRVLWSMFEYGIIDNPPAGSSTTPMPAPTALPAGMLSTGDAVAAEVGAAGTVLLKNDGALPLAGDADSIAVIGSDADHYIDGGGSASVPRPDGLTTILDGITERAGSGAEVVYEPGTDAVSAADTIPGAAPVPSSVFPNGVSANYRTGIENFRGVPQYSRNEPQVNLRTGLANDTINTSQRPGLPFPFPVSPMTVRYAGELVPPATGNYEFSLSHLGTARFYVDDQPVINARADRFRTDTATVELTEGEPVEVRVEYTTDAPNQFNGSLNDQPGAMVRLGWTPPAGTLSPAMVDAVDAARDADVAVVVARDYTGEAADRGTLTLPQDQDRLIRAVVEANPNTVVVLATSGAVLMPWLDEVPAVIEAWYGGQTQGENVASVLWGDVNPSGRLPITFPATEQQPTQIGVQPPFAQVAEVNPTTTYDDGVNIGYRGYAAEQLRPLFPFGHGLSYTTFEYAGLRTQPTADGLDVTFTVRNTGDRRGSEVPQVYLRGGTDDGVALAARALVGYDRVELDPGQSTSVTIPVSSRELSYWSTEDRAWRLATTPRTLDVGPSSTEVRLTATNATAGVFAPVFGRDPDRAGWYTRPVTVSGELAVVGQDATCSSVRYDGRNGRAVPVTVTCALPDGTRSSHRVFLPYDDTAPTTSIRAPRQPSRASRWTTLRGTARAGVGSPLAEVDVRVVQRRSRIWYAYLDGTWRRAATQAQALRRARPLRTSYAGVRWAADLRSLRAGLLLVRATAVDEAGNKRTVVARRALRDG